jgi:hypothetical protein
MQQSGPTDAGELADDAELWRRVLFRNPSMTVLDENEGRVRPSSGAFKDNAQGSVSAYIAAESGGVAAVLLDRERYQLVSFSAGLARACGLAIERDPGHGGSGHVLLVGNKRRRVTIEGDTGSVAEILARKCRWVGNPPPPPQP